jgi:hypothetical protein
MKLGKIATRLIIDSRKLTDYALNPDNPKGKDKAFLFESHLGFSRDNYQKLLEQILNKAPEIEAIPLEKDRHGQRYQVDINIEGINKGQSEIVRTGWLLELDINTARLVTLYVRKRT